MAITALGITLVFGAITLVLWLGSRAVVAGEMTESNVLGYIAPYPIPEVVRNMNAFALGAQSVNPDATVVTVATMRAAPVW